MQPSSRRVERCLSPGVHCPLMTFWCMQIPSKTFGDHNIVFGSLLRWWMTTTDCNANENRKCHDFKQVFPLASSPNVACRCRCTSLDSFCGILIKKNGTVICQFFGLMTNKGVRQKGGHSVSAFSHSTWAVKTAPRKPASKCIDQTRSTQHGPQWFQQKPPLRLSPFCSSTLGAFSAWAV